MLKLKRSFLLLLVLFLAACGTQTQVPEALQGTDEVIELGSLASQKNSSDKFKAVFVKKIEGHAPKGANFKVILKCTVPYKKSYTNVSVVAHFNKAGKATGYLPKKLLGSHCTLSEKGTLGSKVVFKVVQLDKDTTKWDGWGYHKSFRLYQKIHSYGKTHVTSKKFSLLKNKPVLRVIVINKFNKVDKKTDITIVKKFVDGKTDVEVKGEAKIYLVCKVGKDYKVVASFAASKYTEFKTQQYAGLECYLKESFHSDSYTLEDVQISLESGKWGDDLGTNWKVKPGYVVSEHFTIPKSSLKIIFVNVVREIPDEVKKELELVIIKKFELDKKLVKIDAGTKVVLGLFCDKTFVADIELVQGTDLKAELEAKINLKQDYDDCVLKETFSPTKYNLLGVSFDGVAGVLADGVYTSAEFDIDVTLGKIVIIVVNKIELKEDKEPTPKTVELEIIKKFNLDVDLGVKLDLDFLKLLIGAVDLKLVCDNNVSVVIDLEAGTVADLEAKANLVLDKGYENCDFEESFDANVGKLLSVSAQLGEFSTIPVVEAISNMARLDLDLDLVKIDGKLVIIITNNIELKKPEPEDLELVIIKQFRLDGKFITVGEGTMVHFLLFCDDKQVDQFTLRADSEQSQLSKTVTLDGDTESCFFRETFPDNKFDLVSVTFNGASSVRPSGNGNMVESAPFDPRLVDGDFIIINDVMLKRGGGGGGGRPR